jgi:hypothetical protein
VAVAAEAEMARPPASMAAAAAAKIERFMVLSFYWLKNPV